jgi:hypothetical protein
MRVRSIFATTLQMYKSDVKDLQPEKQKGNALDHSNLNLVSDLNFHPDTFDFSLLHEVDPGHKEFSVIGLPVEMPFEKLSKPEFDDHVKNSRRKRTRVDETDQMSLSDSYSS